VSHKHIYLKIGKSKQKLLCMEFHSPLYLYFLFKFLFIPYVKEFHKHLLDILGRLICDYLLYFFILNITIKKLSIPFYY